MDLIIEKDVAVFSRIEAVKMILQTLQKLTGMRLSLVARVDEDSWTACAVLDNMEFGLSPGDQLELTTTYCNTVRETAAPIVVKHASQSEIYKTHPGFTVYGVESYLSVPLFRQNGECFGVMCALDLEPKEFSEELVSTFELFANLVTFELEAEERREEGEKSLKLVEQSNEARARFMSILGHDLRSPLNTIVMAATLQKMSPPDSDKIPQMADKILQTADRMKYLIEDLLDTTQTLQGQEISINRETTALQKICRLIVEEFKIANPNHKIEFYSETDCVGEWDTGRMQQVLSNLLSNAVSYGTSTKPIKIDLIADCDRVVLQVNNQGELISQETMQNLFQPFWRGARKRSNSSGLGLGLYIVQQIVAAHGGKISVESTPEYGTTFTVIFEEIQTLHQNSANA